MEFPKPVMKTEPIAYKCNGCGSIWNASDTFTFRTQCDESKLQRICKGCGSDNLSKLRNT
jgi:hypothetical protein